MAPTYGHEIYSLSMEDHTHSTRNEQILDAKNRTTTMMGNVTGHINASTPISSEYEYYPELPNKSYNQSDTKGHGNDIPG